MCPDHRIRWTGHTVLVLADAAPRVRAGCFCEVQSAVTRGAVYLSCALYGTEFTCLTGTSTHLVVTRRLFSIRGARRSHT